MELEQCRLVGSRKVEDKEGWREIGVGRGEREMGQDGSYTSTCEGSGQ